MSVQNIQIGRPNYLNLDEEALLVASEDIEGDHGLPIDVNTLGDKPQIFIRVVNERQ